MTNKPIGVFLGIAGMLFVTFLYAFTGPKPFNGPFWGLIYTGVPGVVAWLLFHWREFSMPDSAVHWKRLLIFELLWSTALGLSIDHYMDASLLMRIAWLVYLATPFAVTTQMIYTVVTEGHLKLPFTTTCIYFEENHYGNMIVGYQVLHIGRLVNVDRFTDIPRHLREVWQDILDRSPEAARYAKVVTIRYGLVVTDDEYRVENHS